MSCFVVAVQKPGAAGHGEITQARPRLASIFLSALAHILQEKMEPIGHNPRANGLPAGLRRRFGTDLPIGDAS
jgi:hypothetical protein